MLWLIMAITLWGFVHSILASLRVKEFFHRTFGTGLMRIYRLGYNVFAVLSFLPVLWLLVILSDQPFYTAPSPWNYFMFAGQGLAAIFLIAGVVQTDALSFIGFRQVFVEEKSGQLVTGGLYRFMRHPLYTFGLLFLWLTPSVTVNLFTFYLSSTIYIIVGAYFEERKLLREFGRVYADYQKVTPMLIPAFRSNQKPRSSDRASS